MWKLQIFFAGVAKYDRIKHFAAFGFYCFSLKKGEKHIFIKKWLDLTLLMTSYLLTIVTGCRQTLPKCVKRINEHLLKTACANTKSSLKNPRKILYVIGLN